MGETTEIIQKKIRHWKTSIVGVAGLLGPVALSIWPEYSQKIIAVMMAINGVGFMAAADAAKVSQPKNTP